MWWEEGEGRLGNLTRTYAVYLGTMKGTSIQKPKATGAVLICNCDDRFAHRLQRVPPFSEKRWHCPNYNMPCKALFFTLYCLFVTGP